MKKLSISTIIQAAGGCTQLAKRLKVSKQAVSRWLQIPANRVLDIEKITGYSRYDLRPDVFGKKP